MVRKICNMCTYHFKISKGALRFIYTRRKRIRKPRCFEMAIGKFNLFFILIGCKDQRKCSPSTSLSLNVNAPCNKSMVFITCSSYFVLEVFKFSISKVSSPVWKIITQIGNSFQRNPFEFTLRPWPHRTTALTLVMSHIDLYMCNPHQVSVSNSFTGFDASLITDADSEARCGQGLIHKVGGFGIFFSKRRTRFLYFFQIFWEAHEIEKKGHRSWYGIYQLFFQRKSIEFF